MSNLIWNPAIEKINELVGKGHYINGCISAFATADAVEVLAQSFCPDHCYFVTRWRVPELASGVSDIEVYPLLRELDVPLYICLLYTSPSPRDQRGSRMPSSA